MAVGKLTATVLFVHDLDQCKRFYEDMLGLENPYADDNSAAYRIEDHDFVLLKVPAAVRMITAAAVAPESAAGHRTLLCLGVENVDATYQALAAKGLAFLKPPQDQAWGRRTAYFADPEGNLWELWHPLD